ncbi:MAG: hypothetical protein QOG88_1810 [Actinomycetota bacterium]|nr:hypothetical protein [Actinomycetota bacterium]
MRTHHLAAVPEALHRPIHLQMTTAGRARFEFDGLLRHLVTVGFAALLTWAAIGAVGLFAGYTSVDTHQVLKFLLAVLILVFARRTYWEIREWRWKRIPAEERYGFASPLWETPRGGEHVGGRTQVPTTATDPQQVAE